MKQNTTIVTITTAQPLTASQKKHVQSVLNKKVGVITLKEVVDPAVIGGIQLNIGGQNFDITTSGKLISMESLLPQAKVISAVPLSSTQRTHITEIVEKKLGNAELLEEVDPRVIGGLKLILGSQEYDGTIQGKLNQLKAVLLKHI